MAISREVGTEQKKEADKIEPPKSAYFRLFPLADKPLAFAWREEYSGGYSDYEPRVLANGFYFIKIGYDSKYK